MDLQPPEMAYKERYYNNKKGAVYYLDQEGLDKKLDMPKPQILIMLLFVAAAALIGIFLLASTFGQIDGANKRAEAATEANISREVSYDIPRVQDLVTFDDGAMQQHFTELGYNTYLTSEAEDTTGFSLTKLPSDVSTAEAAVMYTTGIARLGSADASKLFKGAWFLTVSHEGGLNIRVRYADFDAESAEAAVEAACNTEGFDLGTVGDNQGVDESGNTYKAGTVVGADGNTYDWQVSAIALSEVYDISGLPENAMYVGIRLNSK